MEQIPSQATLAFPISQVLGQKSMCWPFLLQNRPNAGPGW